MVAITRPAFKVAATSSRPARMTASKPKPVNPWEPYYAWKPVKVGKHYVWNKWVFRKRVGKKWVYGNEFDVLRWRED